MYLFKSNEQHKATNVHKRCNQAIQIGLTKRKENDQLYNEKWVNVFEALPEDQRMQQHSTY